MLKETPTGLVVLFWHIDMVSLHGGKILCMKSKLWKQGNLQTEAEGTQNLLCPQLGIRCRVVEEWRNESEKPTSKGSD